MSLQNLLNQFVGSGSATEVTGSGSLRDTLGKVSSGIPGGLAGGAAAGGIMALLVGNKSARKFAGKAATYGGAAVLGGLAYRAYQQWQNSSAAGNVSQPTAGHVTPQREQIIEAPQHQQPASDMTIIKAMIAAANADGHIDGHEHQRIFEAVDELALSDELKARVFDYLRQPATVQELAFEVSTLEQKSEVYLAACVVCGRDNPRERAWLDALGDALQLPQGLTQQLDQQALQAVN